MKKYLLGVFAIALAVGFSAFSVASKRAVETFYYKGNPQNLTAFQTPSNWSTISTDGTVNCADIEVISCSIQVEATGHKSGNLLTNVNITASNGVVTAVTDASTSANVFSGTDLGDAN